MKLKSIGTLIGEYKIKVFDSKTGRLKRTIGPVRNLIVNTTGYGKDIITRQLGGDITYAIQIDSAKIGTGTTAPASTDTDLETAVLSSIGVALAEYPNPGQVILSFFIPDGDLTNGTYTEFGIFCNGRLFARSLISPNYTKGSNENTTVDYTITFS